MIDLRLANQIPIPKNFSKNFSKPARRSCMTYFCACSERHTYRIQHSSAWKSWGGFTKARSDFPFCRLTYLPEHQLLATSLPLMSSHEFHVKASIAPYWCFVSLLHLIHIDISVPYLRCAIIKALSDRNQPLLTSQRARLLATVLNTDQSQRGQSSWPQ